MSHAQSTAPPDYEGAMQDLCSLLDAIDIALDNGDYERAARLVNGRFEMIEKHGFEVVFHHAPFSGDRQ